MTRSLLAALLCGLFAMCSTGCGPNVKKIVEPYRPDAETRLARLDKILSDCRSRPVATDNWLPAADSNLRPAISSGQSGNVRVLWLQAFDRPAEFMPTGTGAYQAELGLWWAAPRAALAGTWPVKDRAAADDLVKHFQALRDVEYVLVINTPTIEAPRHDHGDWYRMGAAEGCVHLYRMADGKHLGGVTFAGGTEVSGIGAMDFSLTSKDPAVNVENLRGRMYRDLHTQGGSRLTRSQKPREH